MRGRTVTSISAREAQQVEQANASGRTPVVFIHGLWLIPSSWDNWVKFFEDNGYAGITPSWPGDPDGSIEEARATSGDLTDELIATHEWTDQMLADAGIPVVDVPLFSVGGGFGSFVLASFLRMAGLAPDAMVDGRGTRPVWALHLQVLRDLAHHAGHADILREQILDRRAQAGGTSADMLKGAFVAFAIMVVALVIPIVHFVAAPSVTNRPGAMSIPTVSLMMSSSPCASSNTTITG